MKNSLTISIVTFICMVSISCGPSLRVASDFDRTADFSQFKTFSIDTANLNLRISQLNSNRIVNAIRSELTGKGFTETQSDPDLKVGVSTILQERKSVTSTTTSTGFGGFNYGGFYRPWGWGGGMNMGMSRTTYNIQPYVDGSLIIGIANARTNILVWEGIGNKQIDRPLRDPDATISAAVSSILRNFPPGAASR